MGGCYFIGGLCELSGGVLCLTAGHVSRPPIVPETAVADAIKARTEAHLRLTRGAACHSALHFSFQ